MQTSNPTMNTTPLIDVMLVLLVLLILALPISTHKVTLNLPTGREVPPPPQVINVDIDADGQVFWNGSLERDIPALQRRFEGAVSAQSMTQVNVWPDRRVRYERVTQVLAAAQRAHISNLALSPVPD